ncbi:hypothetical protein EJ03DRAFT_356332 [Teratosphaeria nubilosa]|uniref:Uncharacterized protein n=1 Tax=Teratosphaeria nubilosa TaxID=161662 RepID=A0A6G1KU60_9PEZI|nr:hypothetical protein EJ03DRAFT_356332 [Teratosphaeria nubilosa]
MKIIWTATLAFAAHITLVSAAESCTNQADPDLGIGNYCYCASDSSCYAEGKANGTATCNPPGPKLSGGCPEGRR